MKKLFAAALVAIIGMSVFAQDRNWSINFGIGFPQTNGTEKYDGGSGEFKVSGVAFAFEVVNVYPSGFSWNVSTEMGGVKMKNYDKTGFGLNLVAGLGYAPINTDNMTLSILALIGYDMDTWMDSGKTNGVSWSSSIQIYTLDIGGEVYFNYRFTERFGAFASMKLLGAFGIDSLSSYAGNYRSSGTNTVSAFLFKPSFGACIAF